MWNGSLSPDALLSRMRSALMNIIHESDRTEAEYVGQIRFDSSFEGSKSQKKAPILLAEDRVIRVFLIGDNPFENKGLLRLEGKSIRAKGIWKRGVFRIEEYTSEEQDQSQKHISHPPMQNSESSKECGTEKRPDSESE